MLRETCDECHPIITFESPETDSSQAHKVSQKNYCAADAVPCLHGKTVISNQYKIGDRLYLPNIRPESCCPQQEEHAVHRPFYPRSAHWRLVLKGKDGLLRPKLCSRPKAKRKFS
jgi:hypothetical protein